MVRADPARKPNDKGGKMAVKSLQVLFGGSEVVDKSRITYGVAPGTMVDSSHLRFLIRADEGNLLVDTGP